MTITESSHNEHGRGRENREISYRPLYLGTVFFLMTASADIYMTINGIGNDIALEGNPIMRWNMGKFGILPGLLRR